MQSMHILINREPFENLPDVHHLEKYRVILSSLPDDDALLIRRHLQNASLEFYCKCGCHSFFVEQPNDLKLPRLQEKAGLYREIAFKTNCAKELNVMLFVDDRGYLCQVTIYFGQNNLEAIPNNLEIISVDGIWKSGVV